ncbi:MAG: hypothetical protein BRD41_06020 [Bacteroidetes bacterium QS_1_63_11]|nr:MAG: hypothetical protein BRD41_06020 [Bacteroidetes bacterium QS_1_63_11]
MIPGNWYKPLVGPMPLLRSMLIGSTCALGLLCLLLGACCTNGPDTTTSGPDTTHPDAASDTAAAQPDPPSVPTAPRGRRSRWSTLNRMRVLINITSRSTSRCATLIQALLDEWQFVLPVETDYSSV